MKTFKFTVQKQTDLGPVKAKSVRTFINRLRSVGVTNATVYVLEPKTGRWRKF